jgi:hypothetical protein
MKGGCVFVVQAAAWWDCLICSCVLGLSVTICPNSTRCD